MSLSPLLLIIGLIFVFPASLKADVFSCTIDGKTVFTDDEKKCLSTASKIDLKIAKDKRVNYRYPKRQYLQINSKYLIFVEAPEVEQDKVQLKKAAVRLEATLDYIFGLIPVATHDYLKATSFYIMIGPSATLGGQSSGLMYFPNNGDSVLLLGDQRWTHSVVIYHAENFLWLTDLWAKKCVMHELAHAWHYENWSQNYPILKSSWLASQQKGLYLAQKDLSGSLLKPAYASTNEREYFAELSAIYFVQGDYYPFNRQDLNEYDTVGYAMVKLVWGL
jgi:hypothetical protein